MVDQVNYSDPFAASLSGSPGRPLSFEDVLWLLDTGRREIAQPALGYYLAGRRALNLNPFVEQALFPFTAIPAMLSDQAAPQRPEISGLDPASMRRYWEEATAGGNDLARAALEIALDPTSYLGGPIKTVGTKLAAKAPALGPVVGPVARAAGTGLATVDDAYIRATDRLLGGIGNFLAATIGKTKPFQLSKQAIFGDYFTKLLDAFEQMERRISGRDKTINILDIPGRTSVGDIMSSAKKELEDILSKNPSYAGKNINEYGVLARRERNLFKEILDRVNDFTGQWDEAIYYNLLKNAYQHLRQIANDFDIAVEHVFKNREWYPGVKDASDNLIPMPEIVKKDIDNLMAQRHRSTMDVLESWLEALKASEKYRADIAEVMADPVTGATRTLSMPKEYANYKYLIANAIDEIDALFNQHAYLRKRFGSPDEELAALSNIGEYLSYRNMVDFLKNLSSIGASTKDILPSLVGAGHLKNVPVSPESAAPGIYRYRQNFYDDIARNARALESLMLSVADSHDEIIRSIYNDMASAAEDIFSLAMAERGAISSGKRRFEAWLSKEASDFIKPQSERIQRLFDELASDQDRIKRVITKTLEEKGITDAKTIKSTIQSLTPDPQAIIDFLKENGKDPQTINSVESILEKWSLNLFKDDPFRLVARRFREAKAVELGLNKQSIWGRALSGADTLESMLREEALMAPSTSGMNLAGGIFLASLDGTPPREIVRLFKENLQRLRAGGKEFVPSEILDIHEKLGVTVPNELKRQVHDAAGNLAGRPANVIPGLGEQLAETATERVNPFVRGAIGAIQGAGMLSPLGPAGMAAGAAAGAAAKVKLQPKMARLNRAVYDVIEGALRGARYLEKFNELFPRESLNIFDEALRTIEPRRIGEINPKMLDVLPGGPRLDFDAFKKFVTSSYAARQNLIVNTPRKEAFINAIREMLELPDTATLQDITSAIGKNGLLISPDRLRGLLVDAGASVDDAAAIARKWERTIESIASESIKHSNKTNFDYLRTANFEEFLRRVTFFPVWTTRATPIFIRLLVQNPVFFNVIKALNQISMEDKDVPESMRGFVGTGGAGNLLAAALFGRAGMVYINPVRGLIPMADAGGTQFTRDDQDFIGSLVSMMQRFGLGPAPRVSLPLQVLGLAPQDSFNLMRTSQLLELVGAPIGMLAGTGIDSPEKFIKSALRGASEFIGTNRYDESVTGSDYKDQLIRRRIAEMAYEKTGRAPYGVWLEAMNGGRSTGGEDFAGLSEEAAKIWNQARLDVERQLFISNLITTLIPLRTRFMSETERGLRQLANPIMEIPRESLARELLVKQFPQAMALFDTSNTKQDAVQRQMRGYSELRTNMMFLPPASRRRLIDDYLASHQALARYLAWREANNYTGEDALSTYVRGGR